MRLLSRAPLSAPAPADAHRPDAGPSLVGVTPVRWRLGEPRQSLRVQQALLQLAEAAAARHFARRPQALGVALGAGAGRLAAGRRWVTEVDIDGRRWWSDLALTQCSHEPPMLLAALRCGGASAARGQALCREVAEVVPAGSTLLLAVDDRRWLRQLRDPVALRGLHARLRLDQLHRPLSAAGAAWPAWGLLQELVYGQPVLALCEIGVDP